MAGYPPGPPGYGYGAPPPQPYGSAPYGAPPAQPYAPVAPYGAPSAHYVPTEKPPKDKHQGAGLAQPYAPAAPYGAPSAPYGHAPGEKPPKDKHNGMGGYPPAAAPLPFASPFAALLPSGFPPGTDPTLVACFQAADQDGSGFIDDKELQRALSTYSQSFSIRTVRLLMYLFTGTNTYKIGPKEFTTLFYSLQNWRATFQRFDRDQSGKIDVSELREALLSLGFAVSQIVLDLLVSKYDKSGGKARAIEYDNFIECCLTVKGLTDKFKERDTMFNGSATFTYDMFMLAVLPFLIA
ncbi:PREDICTED: probable calcium-binding protein CML50 [Nelumbo nucifera]|uniref:EF-hand domain-containing protein n=2 Tax=Nelumbo nucifera TaxID=4432 RepID=A0A822YEX8_NELNU|nr:PREDICTED: probable calcium-binding protein CML50 [Nelumbo nucifera]DAD29576.1 TPA_asm: hypothetical protein HUJ06_031044 [Nelumbo nucifera]